jgi:hypothetical protein
MVLGAFSCRATCFTASERFISPFLKPSNACTIAVLAALVEADDAAAEVCLESSKCSSVRSCCQCSWKLGWRIGPSTIVNSPRMPSSPSYHHHQHNEHIYYISYDYLTALSSSHVSICCTLPLRTSSCRLVSSRQHIAIRSAFSTDSSVNVRNIR